MGVSWAAGAPQLACVPFGTYRYAPYSRHSKDAPLCEFGYKSIIIAQFFALCLSNILQRLVLQLGMMLRSIVSEKIVKIQISIHSKENPPPHQRTEQHQDCRKHARGHVHSNYHQKLAQRQKIQMKKFKFDSHFRQVNGFPLSVSKRSVSYPNPDMGTVLECLNHTDHVGMLGQSQNAIPMENGHVT